MITEREKKMAIITQWALEGNFCSPESALWLLEEVERLEKELEAVRDEADDEGMDKDLNA